MGFNSLPHDPAPAPLTHWRKPLNGAFEAIEDMCPAGNRYFEREMVVISANLTCRHLGPLFYCCDESFALKLVSGSRRSLVQPFGSCSWDCRRGWQGSQSKFPGEACNNNQTFPGEIVMDLRCNC